MVYVLAVVVVAVLSGVVWMLTHIARPLPDVPQDWQDYGERHRRRMADAERDRGTYIT